MKKNINELCDQAIIRIELLRKEGLAVNVSEDSYEANECREKLLEGAIKNAVKELGKTKSSFKSDKIKEVREHLERVLTK